MKSYMKRVIELLIIMVSCVSISSCSIISEEQKTELNQNKICIEICEEVFEYIKDHDTEKLLKTFSQKAANTHDLEKEIESMYEFIEGDFESYESISDPATGESVRDGKIVRLNGDPWIRGVKTTTGREYIVLVEIVLIYEDEDCEGVAQIGINDVETKERIGVGEPFKY